MLNWRELKREKNFIGGNWVEAESGLSIDVTDPATGETIGTIANAGTRDARRAIDAAKTAFEAWSCTTADHRSKVLRKLSACILDHQDALAELLTREQGKPLAESRLEVGSSAAYILWFAEEARRIYGDIIPSPWPDRRIAVTKEPVGVVGAITPWNFPSSMLARKIGPALAAGCTVVAKPATQTPYSALAYGILAEQAGVPSGVINILTGSAREIGGEMTASPDIAKITFTGSTEVGRLLLRQSADTVKKVSMELGGNAPFIVFDDADLERAVDGAVAAKFRNSGQTCICTNRLYVQAGIYDRFLERFAAAAANLMVGSGLESGITQGPLIDRPAVEKVEQFVADACTKGARIVLGGARRDPESLFFPPTILADARPNMRCSQEEIFGPLAPVYKFETEEEAIKLANDTEYGLACYFYTRDLGRTYRVSEKLKYGLVGVNEGLITTEVAPFGGFKQSGLGKEGSKYGIDDYLSVKYTCIGGIAA
ncbi:NAD-dependent succinate-semialdehyde dehydrogenase [Phyllobacterium zundukense]|uniref:NAD-dependent succinate-semialdehyde dehydrogenase n=1 Tax=Phyllobacterium zundukense TaxID=1867719 RepID=A0ACD4CVP3_9HYPH|nr:NAD-dependent succinate-semialdehyde dehydrogenase [Phyllobacterium zundukense]UXN57650.1 NAD-dependent succinate-semialdehyde dehydrogenase [Phyllobacterium zundukense]